MHKDWHTQRADEFCLSVRDGTHDSPKSISDGKILITSKHITGGRIDTASAYRISDEDFEAINRRSKVDQWDVLISMIGTVGEVCLVREKPDFAIKNIGLFKSKSELDGKWLYYFLLSPTAQQSIRERLRGTTQQYIPLGGLRELIVPVPKDRHQMAAIVWILDCLTNKIELNRKMNGTLEAMARTTFKSWFIDFDPVRAKIDGRWQKGQSLTGLPAELFDLFPNKLEESSIGQIPTSWRVGQLDELADIVGGGTPSTNEATYFCNTGTGIPWLSPKDLSGYQWKYISNGATDITQDGLKNSSAKLMPSGAVLFSSRAPIGYVAISEVPVTTNQGFKSLVPKNGSNTDYLYNFAIHNVDFIEARASGSTFKEISGNGMKSLPALIPSIDLMTEFSKQVIALSNRQRELRHETQSLVLLRDSLLPKLISGELQIKKPDKFLQGVPL